MRLHILFTVVAPGRYHLLGKITPPAHNATQISGYRWIYDGHLFYQACQDSGLEYAECGCELQGLIDGRSVCVTRVAMSEPYCMYCNIFAASQMFILTTHCRKCPKLDVFSSDRALSIKIDHKLTCNHMCYYMLYADKGCHAAKRDK